MQMVMVLMIKHLMQMATAFQMEEMKIIPVLKIEKELMDTKVSLI